MEQELQLKDTSIRVKRETRDCLEEIKIIHRESMDELLKRLIDSYLDSDNEKLNPQSMQKVRDRMVDIQKGNVLSSEDVKKQLFGTKDGEHAIRKSMDKKRSKRP